MEQHLIIIKLLLSAVLGGLIGIEREVHGRPAGFRTHILIATGSALLMMTSQYIFEVYQGLSDESVVRIDPGRIAAMTIASMGFLGAGVIVRERGQVRGLTTAACLWVVTAVGLGVGCGFYLASVITTFISILSLIVLRYVERNVKKDWYRRAIITTEDTEGQLIKIDNLLKKNKGRILKIGFDKDIIRKEISYDIDINFRKDLVDSKVMEELSMINGIKKVQWS
ncbi:MAG: MgtC/SapB family protein [Nitrospinae bacterium]|nr:MgtC/SapB family protein [Nitrospinota bacterium]